MMRAATAIESSTWTDAHLHLWDSSVLAAPWLANAPQFSGCFDFSRYMKDGGVGGGVVLVEANVAPKDRTREAALLAAWGATTGRACAVIAGIEPSSANFEEELTAARALPSVRGARHVLHTQPFESVTQRFEADLFALAAQRLTFDFCVRWRDLPSVEGCARALPHLQFVLDHLGNPPIQSAWNSPERAEWKRLIARVAACDNVSVKWSAMFENAGRALSIDEARPWFEWCVACFGPTRVMWGSNWPVCFSNARLSEWIEVSAGLAGELTLDEQASVLGDNVRRVYRF